MNTRYARYGAPYPEPSVAARVLGALLLAPLVVISAVLFVAFGIAILSLLMTGTLLGFVPLLGLPIGIGILILVAVYLLIALPVGALRRASLRLASGGEHGGWTHAWSGALWLCLVVLLLWLAWWFAPGIPELYDGLWSRPWGVSI
jgi:hypothetical protein